MSRFMVAILFFASVLPAMVEEAREPFFFELKGGDAWMPETHARFDGQAHALGWRHEH